MGADKFDIDCDVARNMLLITIRGHWDLPTVTLYREAVAKAVARMRAAGSRPGSATVLFDARQASAQSQDVLLEYQRNMNTGEFSPRRLATIISSALFKRQAERIALPNQRLFTDDKEALAWLLSPEDRPA